MQHRLANSNIECLKAEDLYNYHIKNRENVFTKFLAWCDAQESNRFLWLSVALFAQIGMTVPLTATCIVFFADNNFWLWIILAVVNLPVLTLNLGAMPTKITLPFVFFAWVTQTIIIMYCLGFALLH